VAATIDDYRWLVSEAAQPWLELARGPAAGEIGPKIISRLRQELSAERAHLVVEQIELRRRAVEKFPRAAHMFFTRQGLEQATDETLARYKAARFGMDGPVVDLCCGIGGDLLALSERGAATGYDIDSIAAVLAGANASALGLSARCQIIVAEAMNAPLGGLAAWHCDPDRRSSGRRATLGELFQPPLDAVSKLLEKNPNAAIKLAPATEAPAPWTASAELEWLGSRGECRQQVTWFGGLARHVARRSATVVGSDGTSRTIVGETNEWVPPIGGVGRYVYEPHAAVLAAGLQSVLCREFELNPIAAQVAYLTGDRPICDLALGAFEVREVLPLDRKRLRAYCRQHGFGRLEIKKRGVRIDPERLRNEIIGRGDQEATLIVTPLRGNIRVIVADRLGGQ
jgi:THUMP domain-like